MKNLKKGCRYLVKCMRGFSRDVCELRVIETSKTSYKIEWGDKENAMWHTKEELERDYSLLEELT